MVPDDGRHLVARSMRETFDLLGVRADHASAALENSVPHGRGFGSSAAAIVAGVLAAGPGGAATERLPDDAVLRSVARIEGHPDNVAACLLGGLTIAWTSHQQPRAVRVDGRHPSCGRWLVPGGSAVDGGRTRPAAGSGSACGRGAHRRPAPLLVEALTRRPDLLLEATEDLLHQTYRASAMPDSLALVDELRARGWLPWCPAPGPSVLVLAARTGDTVLVVDVAGRAGWQVRPLEVDRCRRGRRAVVS